MLRYHQPEKEGPDNINDIIEDRLRSLSEIIENKRMYEYRYCYFVHSLASTGDTIQTFINGVLNGFVPSETVQLENYLNQFR